MVGRIQLICHTLAERPYILNCLVGVFVLFPSHTYDCELDVFMLEVIMHNARLSSA